jgi:hypothetical protein
MVFKTYHNYDILDEGFTYCTPYMPYKCKRNHTVFLLV